MPRLEAYFHYRHIDVSTIKELIARWLKSDLLYKKASTHRAQDDIRESINELKFYKDKIFKA
jgi:oligoribonuclease